MARPREQNASQHVVFEGHGLPVSFFFHVLPPSVNAMYIYHNGGRSLSPKARAWKQQFKAARGGLTQEALAAIRVPPTVPLCLEAIFCLDPGTFWNNSYRPGRRVGNTPTSPFRAIDTDNRIKALQDAIATLLGFQDQNVLDVRASRRPSSPDLGQGVYAHLSVLERPTWFQAVTTKSEIPTSRDTRPQSMDLPLWSPE